MHKCVLRRQLTLFVERMYKQSNTEVKVETLILFWFSINGTDWTLQCMFADLISVSSFDLRMKVDFVFLVGKTTNRRQRCSITNCIIQLSQGGDIGKASSQHLLLWSRWCLNLPPLNTSRLQSLLWRSDGNLHDRYCSTVLRLFEVEPVRKGRATSIGLQNKTTTKTRRLPEINW